MAKIIYGRTQPSIVTNARGLATQGYIVEVTFPDFDEIHDIRVTSLDPDEVKTAAEALFKQREKIAAFNKPAKE